MNYKETQVSNSQAKVDLIWIWLFNGEQCLISFFNINRYTIDYILTER